MATLSVVAPGHDLAVEDDFFPEVAERPNQLGERACHFVERSREEPGLARCAMCLRPDAVVLVLDLDLGMFEVAERLRRIGRRARQHKSNGMEQPHASLGEAVLRGQPQRPTDVAQQHIGALHRRGRFVVRFRKRLFDQALFQPNAQLAGDDLQDVLRFQRRRALQQRLQDGGLRCRGTGGGNLVEDVADLVQRDGRSRRRVRQQHIVSRRAQVAALAVGRR
jgi:hypothetical protein